MKIKSAILALVLATLSLTGCDKFFGGFDVPIDALKKQTTVKMYVPMHCSGIGLYDCKAKYTVTKSDGKVETLTFDIMRDLESSDIPGGSEVIYWTRSYSFASFPVSIKLEVDLSGGSNEDSKQSFDFAVPNPYFFVNSGSNSSEYRTNKKSDSDEATIRYDNISIKDFLQTVDTHYEASCEIKQGDPLTVSFSD